MPFPRLVRTDRLYLRPWAPGDAARLKQAIETNLTHLRAWMAWAMQEPSSLEEIAARVEQYIANFDTADEWLYGVFERDEQTVIGSCGIHSTDEPDLLEIGYWIVASHTRLGYATEAAGALTDVAFTRPETRRVQIRCDPRNVASAGVPRRLGFRHIDTLIANTLTPTGEPRDTMVWELTRDEIRSPGE